MTRLGCHVKCSVRVLILFVQTFEFRVLQQHLTNSIVQVIFTQYSFKVFLFASRDV